MLAAEVNGAGAFHVIAGGSDGEPMSCVAEPPPIGGWFGGSAVGSAVLGDGGGGGGGGDVDDVSPEFERTAA